MKPTRSVPARIYLFPHEAEQIMAITGLTLEEATRRGLEQLSGITISRKNLGHGAHKKNTALMNLEQVTSKDLEQLTEQQYTAVALRYGLQDGKRRTLAKVGDQMGISRQRVHQLIGEALDKLGLEKDR